MERYEPAVDDGRLFLVNGDDRIEIGRLDDVVAAVGGEEYRIEYDERQRTQPWLDGSGELDIDVRETVTTLPHTPETAAELAGYDMDTERYGLPTRAVKFADAFVDILDRQGEDA